MKFLDRHTKNVIWSVVAFLIAYYILKFAGVTIDAGFWMIFMVLILIYVEILDIRKKK
ncbi:MAG: hypothetical protein HYW23_02170 [Candidatus Aenigmarchaeota archaeon]|nr:hypothetical protein [Candidatus Aenigmarchaeota archaeon]